MKSYVIFDLDGCLADDRRRQPLYDAKAPDPYEAYHADCHRDPLINGHILSLTSGFEPIIFTARPESVRAKTEQWLRDVAQLNTPRPRLFMRENGCRKTSPVLKGEFLEALFKAGITPRDIVIAIDDREDVLAVYELYGIRTARISYPMEMSAYA